MGNHDGSLSDAMLDVEQAPDASRAAEIDSSDGKIPAEAESDVHELVCNEEPVENHDGSLSDAMLDAKQALDASCAAEIDSSDEKVSPEAESDVHEFVCNEEPVENHDGSLMLDVEQVLDASC